MPPARTLHFFSPEEAGRQDLLSLVSDLQRGPLVPHEPIRSFEELKGKLEGGDVRYLLIDGKAVGNKMLHCLGEPEPERLLTLSLADLEKRHILRVLASTGGNKTRASRILGIDTKTLYNKLKSYQVSDNARRRRVEAVQTRQKTVQA